MNEIDDERRRGNTSTIVAAWRVFWALCIAGAVLLVMASQIIPIYDYAWDDMTPERVDEDALTVVRWFLQLSYFPAIISIVLPTGLRSTRISSVVLAIVISILLMRLP
ncbi:hypothetical protein ACTWPT_58740 [Nonomuraea sp. 3N208]|uniref:hypothetical protein n=1 Tax=Nonomuraea sp. 3N208 TaxID=3457421 RepID=UPI003FD4E90B